MGSIFIDNEKADRAIDKTESKAEKLGKALENAGKKVTGVGTTMSKWVTGPLVGAAAGLFALATKAGNTADRLLDLSDITGLSTDSIQEWQHVAKQAGVSTEAVTSAAEGLIRRLPGIAKEGGPAYEALQELSLSAEDLQSMSPDEMVDTLVNSLASMEDPVKRNALGAQIFGGAWKDMAPILGMGADEIERTRKEAHDLGAVMGEDALNDANKFRQEIERMKTQFGALFMEIGAKVAPIFSDVLIPIFQDKVMPAISGVIDRVGSLIDWFTSLSPQMLNIVLAAVGVAAALGPVLIVVGKIITVVGTLISFLPALGTAFAVLTGPIGLIVAAIVGLIAIFTHLWKTNEEFRDAVLQVWERIKAAGIEIWELLQEVLIAIWEQIKTTAEAVFGWLQEFWENWGETILAVAQRVWDQIALVIDTAINLIKGVLGLVLALIQGDWEEVWKQMSVIGETIWNFIFGTAENLFGALSDMLSGIWDNVKGKFENTWNAIKNFATNTWNGIRSTTQQIWGGISSWLSNAVNTIYSGVTNTFERIRNRVQSIWDGIYQSIRNILNRIIGAMNSFIRGANRLSWDIPDWVPGLGGRSFGLSIPQIPYLAAGGRVMDEGWAMVGERGPEPVYLPRGAQVFPNQQENFSPGQTFNFEKMFEGAIITIRDDSDIRKLAREIYNLFQSRARGEGVLAL